jgi:hypothetical protein
MDDIQRLRATYEFKPLDRLIRTEFSIWEAAYERWRSEGLPQEYDWHAHFGFDAWGASISLNELGWTAPPLVPAFEEIILEETDDHEVVRDGTGRHKRYPKGKRQGVMPTFLKHPVSDDDDWERDVLPRLSPDTPQRWQGFPEKITELAGQDAEGRFIVLSVIGAYMYLRSLVGPTEICYLLMDNPSLVHKMLQTWLELADAVSAKAQEHVQFDEIFFAEDICYNHGLLISPEMVREFLFPYYQQLIDNVRKRQSSSEKKLHIHIDTDGNVEEAIPLYNELGMTRMSPFEVAAGCDVVAIAKKYPDLVMSGGIDKRVLAAGKPAIDEYLERVIPFMVKRGGYIPTCDHGVPHNVSYDDYMHYRRRMMELDHSA